MSPIKTSPLFHSSFQWLHSFIIEKENNFGNFHSKSFKKPWLHLGLKNAKIKKGEKKKQQQQQQQQQQQKNSGNI